MPKTTKKVLCYTAITGILNLSFPPAYAVKIEELDDATNHSYSHSVMKEDLSLEDPQTHATSAPQSAEEPDAVSWFFLTPLKIMIGVVSLVKQGVRFAIENPGQTMTMGLLLQARTATSTLSLSSLTPLQGFTISGATAGDYSGDSVSSVGDFNGDGLNDVIIGAPNANSDAGQSYVIYGTNSKPSSISLSGLTSLQGFTISGAAAGDGSGQSVSSAGDFNGDGLNDVIIGAPFANISAGNSYLIYGTNSTPSSIYLSSLTPLQGFTISGATAGDYSGWSVSSAGDFNGDGLNDLIIGALGANSDAGNSYVIYGTNSTPSSIYLSSLTPLQGFNITGAAANDRSGYSVSSAGDFNGDGLNDLIIGARQANSYAGKSYVIYGTNSKPSSLSLSSLTPLQGFAINGATVNDESGATVSSAGDFNGDGLNDVIIGAYSANIAAGNSYLIYGTNSTPSSIYLSSLTPLQGFTISGAVARDHSGTVSSAGDFNGDGLNDLIIGARQANSYAGKSYVIYGTNSTPSSLSLGNLTAAQGFTITGAAAGDKSGSSVSSAGDFNGDGLGDVIIGALGANNYTGKSYVIYGAPVPSSPSMMVTTGTSTSTTIPASQMTSANSTSSLGMISNPTSAAAGTSASTPTSQMTSVNTASSPVITTSSPNTEGQPPASEASSQSLSTWLAGAALLIGQERL